MTERCVFRRRTGHGSRQLSAAWLALIALTVTPQGVALAQTTPISAPIVGSDTSTIIRPSTLGKPNLSRVWYNSDQGRWDGLVPKDDTLQNGDSASASDHYILKDVTGSQTFTSVELEDRNTGRPDTFWDDTARTLYVLGSHATASRFWLVDYDPASDTYSIDPGIDGVTVPGITHPSGNVGGNSPASLYVGPDGRVWVAVMKSGALSVQQSSDGGATWLPSAFTLETSLSVGVTTWVHFEHLGTTFIGLFTAENGEPNLDSTYHFFTIEQNADPTLASNWTDEFASMPASLGTERADDHVSAARDSSENLYFAVKTEGGGPTDPLIKVFKRTPDGVWSQFLVTETQETPEQSRPSLVVDAENDELYVYTNDTVGGDGNRVRAKLDSLGDLASALMVVIFDGGQGNFGDLITPRQPVEARTGIVVLAHNRSEDTVWYGRELVPLAPLSIQAAKRGVIPVAILGSDSFDIANVDRDTLAFGPDGATPVHRSGGHVQDVNGDGINDLLSHYRADETGIMAGDMEACVTGATLDGTPFEFCRDIKS